MERNGTNSFWLSAIRHKIPNGTIDFDAKRHRRMLVVSDCPWFKATTGFRFCQASFTICQVGTESDRTLRTRQVKTKSAGSSGWSFVNERWNS
jgi:hypothetical protein